MEQSFLPWAPLRVALKRVGGAHVILGLWAVLWGFAPNGMAQMQAPTFSETYFATAERYQQIKDSLPFYFFTYGKGGAMAAEGHLEEDVMLARLHVFPLPVNISGNLQSDPYQQWITAIRQRPKPIQAPSATSTVPMTKEEKLLYETQLQVYRVVEGEDSIQRRERIARELEGLSTKVEQLKKENQVSGKAPQNTTAKESKSPPAKGGKGNPKSAKTPKEQAPAQTEKPPVPAKPSQAPADTASPNLAKQLKAKGAHDTLVQKVLGMGEEQGLNWLYGQQLKAGNILLCEPGSGIPIMVKSGTEEDIEMYKKVLSFWKDRYAVILQDPVFESQQVLVNEGVEAYYNRFAKEALINIDYYTHEKQYLNELGAHYKP